ncbi:MAG: efflux RND transporter permease subunit, partial [Candidatus Hydrogenedentota bacterium]
PGMKEGDREVPIWAQFREEDRKSRANLDNVMLLGTEGRLVPLNRLVNFGKANTPQSITRMEGKNYITLSAKTDGGDLKQINEDLRTLQREFELPTGYSISLGDELMSFEKDAVQFMTAMVMSIVLIYIVMSALFESLLLPLSILTSVPLAFVGVYWLMYVTSTPMDTVAFIGCILMIGVVVNNGIVIVDRINNLRNEGMDRFDAIIQAGRDRLRPVLMTALTTILGAVPLAIGAGGMGGASIVSLGRAMIGGMITGTFLTLLITPLTYSFIDDVQVWVLRYLGNMSALMRRSSKA